MNTKETLKIFITYVLIITASFSLIVFLYYTHLLNIKKVMLLQGDFKLSGVAHEFDFDKLTNDRYNVILRFFHPKKIDFDFVSRFDAKKVKYSIDVELRDKAKRLLKHVFKNQDSKLSSGGGTAKYFEWNLLSFTAERGQKYNLKILFQSDEPFFDKVRKEIYIKEIYYDYAAMPWIHVFQIASLGIFMISFLLLLIAGIFFWQGKFMIRLAIILLTIISFLSLVSCIYFSYKLYITKEVSLKAGRFEITNNTYEFNFNELPTTKYQVILRLIRGEKLMKLSVFDKYVAAVELLDANNNLLKRREINTIGTIPDGGNGNYFDFYLMDFNAEKGQDYRVKITFHSDDDFLNNIKKEILVADNRYTSKKSWEIFETVKVSWKLYRGFSLGIFIIASLPLLIKIVLFIRHRSKK